MITLKKLPESDVNAYKNGSPSKEALIAVNKTLPSSPGKMTRSQTSLPSKNDTTHPPPRISQDVAPSSPVRFTRSLLNSPIKYIEVAPSSPNKTCKTSSSVISPVKSDRNLRSSPCKNLSLSWSGADVLGTCPPISSTSKKDTNTQNLQHKMDVNITPSQIIEPASVETVANDCGKKKRGIEKLKEVEEKIDVEKLAEAESEAVNSKEKLNDTASECTEDDELDFICTNNEEVVFTNGNGRTYSKLMTARASIGSLPTPESGSRITGAGAASPNASSPEIIGVEMNTSQIQASVDESKEDRPEEISLPEEQESISIFSSDGTKNVEMVDEANNVSASQAQDIATVSEPVVMQDEVLASSSSSKIELVCQDEALPQETHSDTECVFYALLQRILGPYLGPSCLSKWSRESASRAEIYNILRSVDECMEWIQSAGLMDTETRNVVLQLKYFKGNE